MTKSLILFTIGPVQSFIAQARKTHDLYAGSQLLSNLVGKAIDIVGETNLIFPKRGEAMPNRFLAEVPEQITDLNAFGKKVEDAVRDEWKRIANGTLNEVTRKPDGFDQQIENFLEIYWVIETLESDNKYKETVVRLEKNLAALKNIRAFTQYSWQINLSGEQGRKCSLDGQRNVQFYRPKNGNDSSETRSPLYSTTGGVYITSNFPEAALQPGEGLSAVSFVKRRYQYNEINPFDSTTEIALLDALNHLKGDTVNSILLKEYNQQIFSDFNAQLYYEDALTTDFFTKQAINLKNGYSLEEARKKRKALEAASAFRFQKYYAVLTFDGDNMGKWLSGEKLNDKSQLKAFQIKFAECLADFAMTAKQRLNKNSGQTVYAGGDDFLGFVNLNHLLPILKDLRGMFHEKVNLPPNEFKKDKISFSAGICVAHYKEPLTLVLQEAKNAQKKAKDLPGKDAFAITVVKGSGESHTTALPFEENANNIDKFKMLTDALLNEDFSNNFIKTTRLEFERVMDLSKVLPKIEGLLRSELKRLLQRGANNEKWNREEKKQEAENMAEKLMALFGDRSTENFFQMLHIADFFQREMDSPNKINTKAPQIA